MKFNQTIVHSALASVLLLACAGKAGAQITSVQGGNAGYGLDVLNCSVSTPDPGNPQGGSSPYPNTLYYNETFTLNAYDDPNGEPFTLVNEGGGAGYAGTIDVQNTGTQPWTGYSLILLAGAEGQWVYQSGITFDTGCLPTIQGDGTSDAQWSSPNNDLLLWSGLDVPVGGSIELEFNLDIAPGLGGASIINQQPQTVPEPGSMAILALGMVGLIGVSPTFATGGDATRKCL